MLNSSSLMLGAVCVILWVIAACVLRMGCGAVLGVVGGGRGTRKPGLLGAMALVALAAAATVVTQFGLGVTMGMSAFGYTLTPHAAERMCLLLALPVNLIVTATIYKMLLPTSFGRATLIWVVQLVAVVGLFMLFRAVADSVGGIELPELRSLKLW